MEVGPARFLLLLMLDCFQIIAFNIQVPTCPAECICLSQTQVMCNTGGLTEMPLKTIPPTVEYLSLTKNAFAVIKSDAFKGLRNIRKLSLDGNNITMIKPFAFRGLPKLRELSIQHTPLTTISQFSFAGLQNITSILLGHNKIEKIEGYSFAGTSNVRLLLLHNNPVQKVESRAFSGLRNVDHLIFPTGVKNLEADAFSELDYVGILKLAFMDLPYLKPYTFRGLSHVQLLAITDSDLGVIRSNAFDGMTHIGSLNLINNKIDAIQQFHIKKSNNVRVIRLHGNHLLETPRRDAILVQNVETLSVNRNHFPCDCHLHTLLASPLVNSTVDFRQNNYCISPLEVNGKPISQIDVDSLGRCRDEISRGNLDAFQNDSTSGESIRLSSVQFVAFLTVVSTLVNGKR
ncbi:hypothetical protein RUM43_006454 [Polyplax serrata]|uniref:Uncharacterized protein n=1 Tax=Polyplax serrata TaxID=468196 RepID=A0AAN8NTC4_POLSC